MCVTTIYADFKSGKISRAVLNCNVKVIVDGFSSSIYIFFLFCKFFMWISFTVNSDQPTKTNAPKSLCFSSAVLLNWDYKSAKSSWINLAEASLIFQNRELSTHLELLRRIFAHMSISKSAVRILVKKCKIAVTSVIKWKQLKWN